MPKQGREGLSELLGDLWHELTPVVRTCLFAGMGLGFVLTLYFMLQVPGDEAADVALSVPVPLRLVLVMVVGLTALGGFLGTAAGVLLEILVYGKDGAPPRKRRR
jgi:hypothetical protein